MPKSTIELPQWNSRSKNRENRLENIHFLVDQIPKESYPGLRFLNNNEDFTQEEVLTYCELLYEFAIKHNQLEVLVKQKSFKESDTISSMIYFLEDLILSNHLNFDKIDLKAALITLETSMDVFNDFNVYDLNIAFLDIKMDNNLKIGLTQCVNKINISDSGALFDHHEIDWVCGTFYDEPEESNYTKKQIDSFDKTLVKYQEKFDKYLIKIYNPNKKYTNNFEIYVSKLINKILDYDTTVMHENRLERFDGELPFHSLFIPVLRDVTKVSEQIFDEVLETRCRSLGEVDVEYLSQFIEIGKNSIETTVSEEEIQGLKFHEKNISDLCYLLNNYENVKKERT